MVTMTVARPAAAVTTGSATDGDRRETSRPERGGLIVVDHDRRVVLVDPSVHELLGAGAIVADQIIPALYLDAEVVRIERDAGDGLPLRVEVRVRPTVVDGRDGWMLSVVDVSARRSPQREASDMVAAVSHEMRTPLTAITGYAASMRHHWDTLDAGTKLEFLEVIERQGVRLARLASDLLSLARADAGRLDVETEDVLVQRCIAETLEALRGEADGVTAAGDTTVRVRVDPLHLTDILTNFITNAGKYGRPPITIEVTREGPDGVIRVRDEGDGVPAGFVARMWDRFARARVQERPAGVTGSGLGLAVVQKMVWANLGRVWYEPNEPHGSCFAIAFPLADGPDGQPG